MHRRYNQCIIMSPVVANSLFCVTQIVARWIAERDGTNGRKSGGSKFSTPVGRPGGGAPRGERDANQMSISLDNSRSSYGSASYSSSMSVDSSRGVAYKATGGGGGAAGGSRISTTYEGSDEEYAPDFEPDEDGYGSKPAKMSRGGGEGKYSEESKSGGGYGYGYSSSSSNYNSGSARRK